MSRALDYSEPSQCPGPTIERTLRPTNGGRPTRVQTIYFDCFFILPNPAQLNSLLQTETEAVNSERSLHP